MDALIGTWTYAEDPKGEVGTEPLYQGSTMTFTEAGGYRFELAATKVPLEGTFSVEEWGPEGGVLHTDYGQGRTNQLHISLRRDEAGEVVGYVVREGEKKIGGRYYRRAGA